MKSKVLSALGMRAQQYIANVCISGEWCDSHSKKCYRRSQNNNGIKMCIINRARLRRFVVVDQWVIIIISNFLYRVCTRKEVTCFTTLQSSRIFTIEHMLSNSIWELLFHISRWAWTCLLFIIFWCVFENLK